jgi:UTP--glucose-1-phosphate uridylyltransferase
MTTGRRAVIPAAGLGTRLSPLTLGVAKELLPLGAYPALAATLLEAAAAGVTDLVVVTSAAKPQLGRFFGELRALEGAAESADPGRAARLAGLLAGRTVRLVEQPQPLGVLDAVARGLGLTELPCAVVFPDLVHLPDQTALARLFAAQQACGQAVIGLREPPPAGLGGNALAVELPPEYASPAARAGALAAGTPLPIRAVGPQRGAPGELVTTFGQIHTPALDAAIAACCRRHPAAPLADAGLPTALAQLAAAGGLYGVLLPGEIVDLGSLPGYLDAARRFLDHRAALRGLP